MDWFLDLGYIGLFIGTFIAGTIISLSSEILLVGVLLAGGDPWICLAVATLGNGTGALVSYLMGWFARWEWIEKWFKIKRETLERQKARVVKYGVWGAFFSWFPFAGQVFMVALGFYKVRPVLSITFTYAGCFSRFLVMILLYVWFGDTFVEWLKAVFPSFQ